MRLSQKRLSIGDLKDYSNYLTISPFGRQIRIRESPIIPWRFVNVSKGFINKRDEVENDSNYDAAFDEKQLLKAADFPQQVIHGVICASETVYNQSGRF